MTMPQQALEPIERISEVLFGLIMVLTATGTLSVVNAGNPEIRKLKIDSCLPAAHSVNHAQDE